MTINERMDRCADTPVKLLYSWIVFTSWSGRVDPHTIDDCPDMALSADEDQPCDAQDSFPVEYVMSIALPSEWSIPYIAFDGINAIFSSRLFVLIVPRQYALLTLTSVKGQGSTNASPSGKTLHCPDGTTTMLLHFLYVL